MIFQLTNGFVKKEGKMNFTKISILLASILMAVPLNLNASFDCPESGEQPYMPCGYCEEAHEMAYSRREIKTYLNEVQAYMQCLEECINEENAKAENVINEWNSAVQQYSIR
jgi:hypothetical protein